MKSFVFYIEYTELRNTGKVGENEGIPFLSLEVQAFSFEILILCFQVGDV